MTVSRRARTIMLLLIAVLGGCGASRSPTTPRSRVALDLGCVAAATSVEEIGPVRGERADRWQVRGCGLRAVYICTRPVRDCWREGEVQTDVAPK